MTTETKTEDSSVHPANRHLLGVHDTRMLQQCGGVAFDKLSAATRITFDANFRKYGSIHGPTATTEATLTKTGQPTARRGVEDLDSVKLPFAARNLQGAQRIDAARRVIAANAAKVELEALKKSGGDPDSNRAYQLGETIRLGWGGSP